MDLYSLPDDGSNAGNGLEKKLQLLNALTRNEFDQAEKLIGTKLQASMTSLQQSAAAITMLLAAQTPADRETPAGIATRKELEALLASSTHLSRLTSLIREGFSSGRQAHEQRTDREITKVVEAVEKHRTAVQDNAIAITEAALAKARSTLPASPAAPFVHLRRAIDRRAR